MKRSSTMEDNDIVSLYFNRDEKAILETEKKYKNFIFSICNGILRQEQDTDECVNVCYMKIWKSIPPAKPRDLKAFIARIARTTAMDRYRSNNRQKRGASAIDTLDDYAEFLEMASDRLKEDETYKRYRFVFAEMLTGGFYDLSRFFSLNAFFQQP